MTSIVWQKNIVLTDITLVNFIGLIRRLLIRGLWWFRKHDAHECAIPACIASTLALEAGHAGAHDFVDKQEVAGNDRAGVDHLLLDAVRVVDALVDR